MKEAIVQLIEEIDGEAMRGDILVDKEFSILAMYKGLEKMPTQNWKPCHINISVNNEVIATTSRKFSLPRPSMGFIKKYMDSEGLISKVKVETNEDGSIKVSKKGTITIKPA